MQIGDVVSARCADKKTHVGLIIYEKGNCYLVMIPCFKMESQEEYNLWEIPRNASYISKIEQV